MKDHISFSNKTRIIWGLLKSNMGANMIIINFEEEEFTIEWAKIQTTNNFLKEMFVLVSEEPIQPHEGDVDSVLGKRMMHYLPGSKIVKFKPAPLDPNVVY